MKQNAIASVESEDMIDVTLSADDLHVVAVQKCYRTILGRPADTSGLRTYVDLLRSGGTTLDIALALLSSAEYTKQAHTPGDMSRAMLALALSEVDLTDDWCRLITYLSDRGEVIGPSYREESSSTQSPVRRSVGRVALDENNRPVGWAVNLAAPEMPVEIRFQTATATFGVRTLGGSAGGCFFAAPDEFARSSPESFVATADGEAMTIDGVRASAMLFVARRLVSKRVWFREILPATNPSARFASRSPLDTHARASDPALSDHLLHVLATRELTPLTELSQAQIDAAVEWYILDFREAWNHPSPFPVSDRLTEFLQESVFAPNVSPYYMPRLLFMFWRRHFKEASGLFEREANRRLIYKLVSSPNAGTASFLRVCGQRLLAPLAQRHPESSRLPLGINWYWHIALSEEHKTESLERVATADYLASSFQKLYASVATGFHLQLIPGEWLRYWLTLEDGGLTRAEWQLCYAFLGLTVDEKTASAWLRDTFYRNHPQFRLFQALPGAIVNERSVTQHALRFATESEYTGGRLYVIGHTSTTGLGANLWMSVSALKRAGIEPVVASVDSAQLNFPDDAIRSATVLDRPVVLFHVNADRVPQELARLPQTLQRDAYRIGFFLWETSVPPDTHLLGLELMDEVWVPTEYLAKIYRNLTRKPVHVVRKGLVVPDVIKRPGRDMVGAKESDFVFLAIGDFHSSIPRKHPLAAVKAFKLAFPERQDVRLILKVRNVDHGHWSNRGGYWQKVEQEIGNDDRIVVFDESLSDSEYWGLIDDSDAFVSLHRSEGFGYGIAHAMLRMRPVVVSDYSGSQDFCTPQTAWLVPVTEIPVARHEMPNFDPRARWAEPDIVIAADAMRTVAARDPSCAERAARAQELISSAYSLDALASTYLNRIKEAGISTSEHRGHPQKSAGSTWALDSVRRITKAAGLKSTA